MKLLGVERVFAVRTRRSSMHIRGGICEWFIYMHPNARRVCTCELSLSDDRAVFESCILVLYYINSHFWRMVLK